MGALQAQPVFWDQAEDTKQLDSRIDVEQGGGLQECAK